MTDKEVALQALNQMPENVTLVEIIESFQILACLQKGRQDIAEGRTKDHEEVVKSLDSWASKWGPK